MTCLSNLLRTRLRSILPLILVAGFALVASLGRAEDRDWSIIQVPGTWEESGEGEWVDYDGFAWYRALVRIPSNWKDLPIELSVRGIDNVGEFYFEGKPIGRIGSFPPDYVNGVDEVKRCKIPPELIRPGQLHWVAVRVYDKEGRGGFKGPVPVISTKGEAVQLKGGWEFRTGDDVAWAKPDAPARPEGRPFEDIFRAPEIVDWLTTRLTVGGAKSPAESLAEFVVSPELALDQVLHEPTIEQPVFLNFDERGRLWVVEYRQYPHPAGVRMLSRDKFWRAVYDKIPPAPPNHFKGKDRISIHEDTDGDGVYDQHKVFVDELNIATAIEFGRGGKWVLNPPYLLFYPDKDGDDVPDGDPEVHLAGFGLEDTHSVANSLTWGPDGWLYAAQGSTVTGQIYRPGIDPKEKAVSSMGQLIWRYHPEQRRYEIFAEGGGNTFGCEFDSKGRVFSGHNGGDTRGFHYDQGAYYQKGFSKHGPLSNPYSFGYFPQMKHPPVARFTHTFIIYEGAQLPGYEGILLGVAPLQSHVVASRIMPDGSTFRTEDVGHPITTVDGYFKPVEIKAGPDGAVYVADWYDFNVNHYRNHEGNIDPKSGRVYRLRRKDAQPVPAENMALLSSDQLVDRLSDPNEWVRRTAQRLLADRNDTSIVPRLRELLDSPPGQLPLEALWALHAVGEWSDEIALVGLAHADPHVRRWSVRLIGDDRSASPTVAVRLVEQARREVDAEAVAQIACSVKRLPTTLALDMSRELLMRDEFADDLHIPLLVWWGIESQVAGHPEEVLRIFADKSLWSHRITAEVVSERLMRRFAATGARQDLLRAAQLFRLAPDQEASKRLMAGFEQAFAGRSLADLPIPLAEALADLGEVSVPLGLRLGREEALGRAIALIDDPKANQKDLIDVVKTLGEVNQPRALESLIRRLGQTEQADMASDVLTTLARYPDAEVGSAILAFAQSKTGDLRTLAYTTLASRADWTERLLAATSGSSADEIPLDVVRRMAVHRDPAIAKVIRERWGEVKGIQSPEAQAKIDRCRAILGETGGTPYAGYQVFTKTCGRCHKLFGEGGEVGPDLSSYKRDDLDAMLLAVVHPSAEIREGFETHQVFTTDGRAVAGFIADQDEHVVVLRTAEGQSVSLARDEIDEMERSPRSVMPDGLLDTLADQQIRDLFSYLRSTQPLNQ